MATTKIPWTQHTWNPEVGCAKVSPGCAHCYGEPMATRLAHMGQANYQRIITAGRWNGKVAPCSRRHWDNVPKSGMCFVCSMGDLFYEGISDERRDEIYSRMLQHHQTTFQVLTKRPERALAYYENCIEDADQFDGLPSPIVNAPNIWLGVTAENQEWADRRIAILKQIEAVVLFVSCEPLLAPIDIRRWLAPTYRCECGDVRPLGERSCPRCGRWPGKLGDQLGRSSMVNWVIVGCESGPGRRPCELEWVADIVDQCHAAAVPPFVKQVDLNGKVVKDPQRIAAALNRSVEEIQQWPDPGWNV